MIKPPILSEDELIAAYEDENPGDDHAIGCASVARRQLDDTYQKTMKWLSGWILNHMSTEEMLSYATAMGAFLDLHSCIGITSSQSIAQSEN